MDAADVTPEHARFGIAIALITAFFGILAAVLMGFVDIREPEMAKLVGLIVGTVGGWVGRVIFDYFKEAPK